MIVMVGIPSFALLTAVAALLPSSLPLPLPLAYSFQHNANVLRFATTPTRSSLFGGRCRRWVAACCTTCGPRQRIVDGNHCHNWIGKDRFGRTCVHLVTNRWRRDVKATEAGGSRRTGAFFGKHNDADGASSAAAASTTTSPTEWNRPKATVEDVYDRKKSYICEITTRNLAGVRPADSVNGTEERGDEGGVISVRLDPRLVAVTGETGSGKSLLLGTAARLAVGGKASSSLLSKHGEETAVEMVVRLRPPHLEKVQSLLEEAGLDPQIVFSTDISDDSGRSPSQQALDSTAAENGASNIGTLRLSRVLSLATTQGKRSNAAASKSSKNKRRTTTKIVSKCTINSVVVSLGTLRTVAEPILASVDSAAAATALSRPAARMAAIDRGVPEDVKEEAREARRAYRACRAERERLEGELERRVLPASFSNIGDSDGDDGDLCRHWVEELDGFEERMRRFKIAATSQLQMLSQSPPVDEDNKLPDFKGETSEKQLTMTSPTVASAKSTRNGAKSLHAAAKALADSEWFATIDGSGERTDDGSSDFYPNMLDYRDAVRFLEAQLDSANEARDAIASLTSSESAAAAVERARNHLYDVASETRWSGDSDGPADPIACAVERSHDLLNSVEDSLAACCRSLQGDRGLIEELEAMRQSVTVTNEDIDSAIAEWNSLSRKHGVSPYSLTVCHRTLRSELDGTLEAKSKLPIAVERESDALEEFDRACQILTAARRDISARLSAGVTEWLPRLGMGGSEFRVRLNEAIHEPSSAANNPILGTDSVDFTMTTLKPPKMHIDSTNSGWESIDAVASSGEKARILLAIETELPGAVGASCGSAVAAPPTRGRRSRKNVDLAGDGGDAWTESTSQLVSPVAVLYDEIDAHVGGRSAVALGRLLSDQSRVSGQVISITHSASVAAIADQHVVVRKNPRKAFETEVPAALILEVSIVDGVQRRRELARMASGDMATAEAELFAEALMRDASQGKLG